MPYALFENDVQLSRPFDTEEDVWVHAREAGLVEDDRGVERLDHGFAILPCLSDPLPRV